MMTRREADACRMRALAMYEKAGIILTDAEKEHIEVADFGLGMVEQVGLQLLTYINTERVCAKEMVLFPRQTCPEHWHIGQGDAPGKEETFRCRHGLVYLYVDGEGDAAHIAGQTPPSTVTVFHEVTLRPGEQYTLYPGTKHWFQAGAEGAVISEFSTHSKDETDRFTDERIQRIPQLTDEEATPC